MFIQPVLHSPVLPVHAATATNCNQSSRSTLWSHSILCRSEPSRQQSNDLTMIIQSTPGYLLTEQFQSWPLIKPVWYHLKIKDGKEPLGNSGRCNQMLQEQPGTTYGFRKAVNIFSNRNCPFATTPYPATNSVHRILQVRGLNHFGRCW